MPKFIIHIGSRFFFAWLDGLREIYPGFFNPENGKATAKSKAKAELISSRYGWFAHFHILAEGNVLRLDAVSEVNVHTAIFTLAFKSDITS